FFFQAEDGIRDFHVTGVQTCALPIFSSSTFLLKVAELAGIPPPPQVSMVEAQLTFTPDRLSFLSESRHVLNERMRKHLGVKLKYADYAQGIRASLEG